MIKKFLQCIQTKLNILLKQNSTAVPVLGNLIYPEVSSCLKQISKLTPAGRIVGMSTFT